MDRLENSSDYSHLAYNLWTREGKHMEAELALKRAILMDPHDSHFYYNWAKNLRKQGKYQESVKRYRIVLKLCPTWISPYIECANVLFNNLEKGDEASQIYDNGFKMNPSDPYLYHHCGLLYRQQEKYDQAIELYKKVLEGNTNDHDAYSNWGVALYHQYKYEEAIAKFQHAISLKSNQSNFYLNLGLVLQQQSKNEEAMDMYNKGLKQLPDVFFTRETLIVSLSTEIKRLEKKMLATQEEKKVNHMQVTIDGMNVLLNLAKAT